MDYYQRLVDDVDLARSAVPDGYPPAMWQRSVEGITRLDFSLANQLIAQSYRPMASIRGLGETLIRASKDGTMQPVAVYVPTTLRARPQRAARRVSSRTPAVGIVADRASVHRRSGRTHRHHHRGAVRPRLLRFRRVRRATCTMRSPPPKQAFTIDPRKRYLAGYSMGGFSVYFVAPIHPQRMVGRDVDRRRAARCARSHLVTSMLPTTPFYILTGARDEGIPTQYPTTTAVFLRNSGVPVTFYSDPNATHRLYSLRTILEQAWNDMENGIVRTPWALTASGPLPAAPLMTPKT